MKVAFATHDMQRVDAHFNGARTFAIYEVGPSGNRFVEVVGFAGPPGPKGENEDRIDSRIAAISDCAMVFVGAIGGPAAARVVRNRIHPVKARADEPIPEILARLEDVLKGDPPPWLRKTLRTREAAPDFTEAPDDYDD